MTVRSIILQVLIDGGRMCSSDRTINEQQFETIMRRQLKEHVQRDLTDVMAMNRDQVAFLLSEPAHHLSKFLPFSLPEFAISRILLAVQMLRQ